MKKQWLCLILAFLLFLGACRTQASTAEEQAFLFYFPAQTPSYQDSGALCTLRPSIEPETMTLEQLVTEYLQTAPPQGGESPIPSQWSFESAELQNSAAILVFSGNPATPLERSLSATCISKTLLQLEGVQRVSIKSPENTEPLSLSADDFALEDTGMLPQKETLILYHPDAEQRYLVREIQTVEAMEAEEKPEYLMRQLLSAKQRGQVTSCIPDGTELLSIHVENGICTVDLSSEFQNNFSQGFSAERMAIYSIVNSLTELPEINTVDLWVAGAPLERLCCMELSSGLVRDERLIAIPESRDSLDVTIYPVCASETHLVSVPLMLQRDREQQLAVQVMEALMTYEGSNGVYNCIPKGTKILSLRLEGNACIIDLTGEFIDGCTDSMHETMAVRSTVATLCTLSNIATVEILVEGIAPMYRNSALNGVQTMNEAWLSE